MTQSSGVSLAASTDTLRPLMVRLGIFLFPCRCMKPLTAASHLWAKPRHPPGRCRDEAQNDRVPIWKQFKLESAEENKLAKMCCALRHFLFGNGSLQGNETSQEFAMPKLNRDGVNIHY